MSKAPHNTLIERLHTDYKKAKANRTEFPDTSSFREAIDTIISTTSDLIPQLKVLLFPWINEPHLGNVSSEEYAKSPFPLYTVSGDSIDVKNVHATRFENINSNMLVTGVIIPGRKVNNTIFKIVIDHNHVKQGDLVTVSIINGIPNFGDNIGLFKPGVGSLLFELNRISQSPPDQPKNS